MFFTFQCFWALGACFEVTLALVVMPTLGWHWLLALSTGPLLAFALICPVSIQRGNFLPVINLKLLHYAVVTRICEVSRCKWTNGKSIGNIGEDRER